MKLHEIRPPKGAVKKRKRVGRGQGSGHGKTSCKGHKGQKARSGGNIKPGFEGGRMPLQRLVPKKGFNNIFRKEWTIINIKDLVRFEKNTIVEPKLLENQNIINKRYYGIKVLGKGELTKPLIIRAHKFSKKAEEIILAAGGKVEVIKL